MRQSLEILNVFNTLTLKRNFLRLKTQHFHTKLPFQKPVLDKEWGVQNGPITKNRVLPLTTFFLEICFSLRTFYKVLI